MYLQEFKISRNDTLSSLKAFNECGSLYAKKNTLNNRVTMLSSLSGVFVDFTDSSHARVITVPLANASQSTEVDVIVQF